MSLRICMLTTFYPPHNFGGDGIAVQRLAHALARRGHHVTVVHDVDAYNALYRGPEPATTPEPEGVHVVRLRSGFGVLSPLLTQQTGRPVLNGGRIRRLLQEDTWDVTLFHNVSLVGGPGVLREGRGVTLYEAHEHWLVCPTHVLWRHGREACPGRQCLRCTLAHRRPPQLWRYTGRLERELRHVDAFIAKSEFSRAKHYEFGFPRQMEVVPYFLPDEDGDGHEHGQEHEHEYSGQRHEHEHEQEHEYGGQEQEHEQGDGRGRPYFLFVGRLERIKGLDDVIPAMARYAEADLVIAGEGEHGPALRQLAAGRTNVRFLGRVTPKALNEWYRGAIALIVPSVCFETFGLIVIEAFRQGTPVLARRIGPFPELIETSSGGILFESEDDLLDAMRRMQARPAERAAMSRAARTAFESHWTEAAVLPRYLELIRDAAERKGAHQTLARLPKETAA